MGYNIIIVSRKLFFLMNFLIKMLSFFLLIGTIHNVCTSKTKNHHNIHTRGVTFPLK